jgi:hypothetical protein
MRYSERPEFPYDPEVFKKKDTQTALRIYAEATRKHSANPPPTFLEVDRSIQNLDPLWHTAEGDGRERILRQIKIPSINLFPNGKNEWTMTKYGMVPQRRDDFIISHRSLIEFDYFPVRGDYVLWNGYTYMLTFVEIPGDAYWHQTNIWLGLKVKCMIPAAGDGMPSFPPVITEQQRLPSLDDTVLGGKSPPDGPPVTI